MIYNFSIRQVASELQRLRSLIRAVSTEEIENER